MNISKYGRWIMLVALAVIVAVLFALPRFLQRQGQSETAPITINTIPLSSQKLTALQQQSMPRAGNPENVSPLPTPEASSEPIQNTDFITTTVATIPGTFIRVTYNDPEGVNIHECEVAANGLIKITKPWNQVSYLIPSESVFQLVQAFDIRNQLDPMGVVKELNPYPSINYGEGAFFLYYGVVQDKTGEYMYFCIWASLTNWGDP